MNVEQTDLTQGSVRGQLIRYAVPMITTSLLQALYSIADIMIAGHFVGSRAISAINNASQIMNMMTQIAIGLTLGGNILIGQYFGSKDHESRKKTGGTLFSLAGIFGILAGVLLFFGARNLLTLLGAPSLNDAVDYLHICAIGCIFILGYNALSAIMRGVGNSKTPLFCILIATTTNVILDLVFIGILRMGTKGAAYATLISQAISFSIAFVYIFKNKEYYGFYLGNFKIQKDKLIKILRLGIPCVLQNTIASISWLVVTYFINQYGINVSAGNGVSIKIKEFCQLFIAAMANGAATMIAQTLGAKKFDRAKAVMYEAMKISLCMAVFIIVIVQLFAPYLVTLFTSDQEVAAAAVLNLRIEIFGQLFYAMFLTYHALMIGAGHTLYVMGSSFVNCILVRVVLVVILSQTLKLPGIYLACMIAPISSVPLGYIYTKSNIWRRNIIKLENTAKE